METEINSMTSRQRVLAALSREPVDRTPVCNPTSVATVELMDLVDAPFPDIDDMNNTVACLEDLVDAHEGSRQAHGDIEVTHHVTEACIAVAESHLQGGAWIDLPVANRDMYIFHV